MTSATRRLHGSVLHGAVLCAALALSVAGNRLKGDEAKQEKQKESAASKQQSGKKVDLTEVKRERFRIDIDLKGHFAPVESHRLVIYPRAWSTLKVKRVAAHGTRVRKGEIILELQSEKLARQITELRRQLHQSELALQIARIEYEINRRLRKLDQQATRRNAEVAQNQLEYYLEVGRPLDERSTQFSLQSSQHRLEYAQEELRQLRKMYEADELTEESEEIVLKRAEREVESARFYLEMARINAERRLSHELPRRVESLEDAAKRAQIALESQEQTRELSARLSQLQMEARLRSHEKLKRQLADYEHDVKLMKWGAPCDGIVYYGDLSRGRIGDAQSAAARLRPGSSLMSGSVILTLVAPRPLQVAVEVPEGELYRVRSGQTCRIHPTAFPRRTVAGHVKTIGSIPLKPGSFAAELAVESVPDDLPLMPGMAARATVRVYDNPNTITLPVSAVKEIDGQSFVWVDAGGGSPQRREVRTGKRTKDKIEIVGGLQIGEQVRTKAPK